MHRIFIKSMIMLSAVVAAVALSHGATAADDAVRRYVGGDISLLPEYESAGAKYKTHDGEPIAELLPWLYGQGMNAMRVRLFVNPADYTGDDADPNACQTMEYILPLCQRIKQQGMALMLDFHYSDTWADPAKQWIPKAWEGLTDDELYIKIYDYTRESLATLKEAGVIPDFIQTGNEISYGMLWGRPGDKPTDLKKVFAGSDKNWDRFAHLLKEAIRACREECPQAQIVIHTERVKSRNELN
ncbi:MAG: arabinogalactan endo-1,4-beta-galactosidase, partial [Muribaculaceae bacterium]|nr:arabinogalactan endo-1,4-beta-galactosidase [Muribaculaceae bacterium]